jgi:hypothetical protein
MPIPDQWVIEILDAPNGGVAFRPDVRRARKGQALRAKPSDLVLWSNRTNRDLTLEATDPADLPHLGQMIPAGQPSSSLFPIPGGGITTIKYRCKDPPKDHRINVAAPLVG